MTPTTHTPPHSGSVAPQARSDGRRPGSAPVAARRVVAVILECRRHVLLLKRSLEVSHDQGKWHCVTGYVETDFLPVQQALHELYEETGLMLADLTGLDEGPVLTLPDARGRAWQVHTFRAQTLQRRLTTNWENTAYRWVLPRRLRRFDGRVSWLDDVLEAVATLPTGRDPR